MMSAGAGQRRSIARCRDLQSPLLQLDDLPRTEDDAVSEDATGGDEDDAGVAVDPEALGELAALRGVVRFPVRIKCATLSWNTLVRGLDEIEAGAATLG